MRYLLVDIGAGTMDVLYYDDEADLSYKAVAKSPIKTVAEAASAAKGNIVATGSEMGGGSVSQVLRQRAQSEKVAVTASAAATLNHDPDKVRSWGISIVDDGEAENLKRRTDYTHLVLEDLNVARLEQIVAGFGVPFDFDTVAVCAQDHGVPPEGVSHLDYRHNLFASRLDEKPFAHVLLYPADEVPVTFNRLACIARKAKELPADNAYIMDSGMAAILGASLDVHARSAKHILVLDIATSHTVAAVLSEGAIAAFFEYHTHDISMDRIDELLKSLAEGRLEHGQILKEGGHGAYTRTAVGFESIAAIIATGPKRRLISGSRLPIIFGAPLGDNMMTGTAGMLEAVRRRQGLESLSKIHF